MDPNNIEAQIEGAIVYGLSALLFGEINLENGAVAEGNFDRYRMLTLAGTPTIEVELISSDHPPTGIGELGTPAGSARILQRAVRGHRTPRPQAPASRRRPQEA